jgi:hypothetical protein
MKFGIYKWDWRSNPQKSNTNRRVLYYDSLRIADQSGSYRDVDPANVTPQAVVLRPREDVASWTVHGAATASAAIDDAVTRPAPVESSDYIWAGGVGRVTEVSVGWTSTGSASTAQAWFYANTGRDTRLKVEVLAGAPRSSAGWLSTRASPSGGGPSASPWRTYVLSTTWGCGSPRSTVRTATSAPRISL